MMTDPRLRALAALRFNTVQLLNDVWNPAPFHVESLHYGIAQLLLAGLVEARTSRSSSPLGLVVQGQKGTGKTHLLGWTREQFQREGGYFFLIDLLDSKDFWKSVAVSVLNGLWKPAADGRYQITVFLEQLASLVGAQRMVRRAVTGHAPLSAEDLNAFIQALRRFDRTLGIETQDTARALVLFASQDMRAQDIGQAFLCSMPEGEAGERNWWGIRQIQKTPQEVVRDVSRLLALTGPSVFAVDQIDTLIAQSALRTDGNVVLEWRDHLMIEEIAGGLMTLREVTQRTLTIFCCLPQTWMLIESYATDTVQDRFSHTLQLHTIPDARTGRALVEKRFAARFQEIGFVPPYPTWPVKPSAFEEAPDFTPRQLLNNINDHIQDCLLRGEVREMERLSRAAVAPIVSPVTDEPTVAPVVFADLDHRFAVQRETADVTAALDAKSEDTVMPALLAAGLEAWIAGQGKSGEAFTQDPPPSAKPPLHARLRRVLNEATEDEAHWAFRAIAAANANAALTRLRNACVAAGLDAAVPKRRLFVLRNAAWAKGPRTQEALAEFEQAGGRVLQVTEDDLRTLAALRALLDENPQHLREWLAARRPAADVKFLNEALSDALAEPWNGPFPITYPRPGDPAGAPDTAHNGRDVPGGQHAPGGRDARNGPDTRREGSAPPESGAVPTGGAVTAAPGTGTGAAATGGGAGTALPGTGTGAGTAGAVSPRPGAPHAPYLTVGRMIAGGAPVSVELEALRKHTVIFAGSGSGKTVLIRRLVEECALQGVSAIVLDPNNDLARLGHRWPEPPPQWEPGDAEQAERYLAGTEVVTWTPGRTGGRPLSFQPLPDFASVLGDPDEFAEAVEVAVASIVPKVRLSGNTARVVQGKAVLREAVEYCGRRGVTGLNELVAVLSALPEGLSRIDGAERIAAELARTLTAAMVNDPLFGGEGTPVDPGLLLTPSPGKRARISVISFVGLPSDEQRQNFVNQLQMALFAWIKKNPAGDRPLGGLFVMDEAQTFAPSGGLTACTQSTLALASQARKYGLGLVFATQAPRGLHNRIPGNAATQFFGLMNSPATIGAAKEMAQAKGGSVDDIGRLTTGEFYVAVEGAAFAKIRTPMCLSHHSKAPLAPEEVVRQAKGA